MAALGVTVLLLRRSILTEKLARRGQHIAREYSVDLFELMRVGEVMDRQTPDRPGQNDRRGAFRSDCQRRPSVSRRQGLLIVDAAQKLAGIITRGDLLRACR